MNVFQLDAFLKSPRVSYLKFQDIEIIKLFQELRMETLDTAKPTKCFYRINSKKDPNEELGRVVEERVDNFIKEVLNISNIDLMPEYLEAIQMNRPRSFPRISSQV